MQAHGDGAESPRLDPPRMGFLNDHLEIQRPGESSGVRTLSLVVLARIEGRGCP